MFRYNKNKLKNRLNYRQCLISFVSLLCHPFFVLPCLHGPPSLPFPKLSCFEVQMWTLSLGRFHWQPVWNCLRPSGEHMGKRPVLTLCVKVPQRADFGHSVSQKRKEKLGHNFERMALPQISSETTISRHIIAQSGSSSGCLLSCV